MLCGKVVQTLHFHHGNGPILRGKMSISIVYFCLCHHHHAMPWWSNNNTLLPYLMLHVCVHYIHGPCVCAPQSFCQVPSLFSLLESHVHHCGKYHNYVISCDSMGVGTSRVARWQLTQGNYKICMHCLSLSSLYCLHNYHINFAGTQSCRCSGARVKISYCPGPTWAVTN